MLVFTRRCYEAVIIGEEVEVTVLDIPGGSRVCLRVTAPEHIPVHRKEVDDAITAGNPRPEGATSDGPTDPPEEEKPGDVNEPATHRGSVIFSRQLNESIMIGDAVEVMVVDIRPDMRGNRVRLGIAAPRHIPVHRKEVYEAIKRTNEPRAPHGTDGAADQA